MQSVEVRGGQRGDIAPSHLALHASETKEAALDLASISQLLALLKRLGLILTSQIE